MGRSARVDSMLSYTVNGTVVDSYSRNVTVSGTVTIT